MASSRPLHPDHPEDLSTPSQSSTTPNTSTVIDRSVLSIHRAQSFTYPPSQHFNSHIRWESARLTGPDSDHILIQRLSELMTATNEDPVVKFYEHLWAANLHVVQPGRMYPKIVAQKIDFSEIRVHGMKLWREAPLHHVLETHMRRSRPLSDTGPSKGRTTWSNGDYVQSQRVFLLNL